MGASADAKLAALAAAWTLAAFAAAATVTPIALALFIPLFFLSAHRWTLRSVASCAASWAGLLSAAMKPLDQVVAFILFTLIPLFAAAVPVRGRWVAAVYLACYTACCLVWQATLGQPQILAPSYVGGWWVLSTLAVTRKLLTLPPVEVDASLGWLRVFASQNMFVAVAL